MIYIVPSRNRPQHVQELIQQWDKVTEDCYLHIALDSDDPQLQYTLELLPTVRPFFLEVSISEPRSPIETLNQYAVKYAHDHDMVGYMTVRHRPQTIGWDAILAYLLQSTGKTGLIWPNTKPNVVLMTSDIIRALGCMVPPVIQRYGAAEIWEAWAADLGGFEATGVEVTRVGRKSSTPRYPAIKQLDDDAMTEYFIGRFETDMKIIKGVKDAS